MNYAQYVCVYERVRILQIRHAYFILLRVIQKKVIVKIFSSANLKKNKKDDLHESKAQEIRQKNKHRER